MLWPTTNASPGNTGGLPVARLTPGLDHVLPDLPIAQIMFLGGIGLAALGVLGLSRPAAAGPGWRLTWPSCATWPGRPVSVCWSR